MRNFKIVLAVCVMIAAGLVSCNDESDSDEMGNNVEVPKVLAGSFSAVIDGKTIEPVSANGIFTNEQNALLLSSQIEGGLLQLLLKGDVKTGDDIDLDAIDTVVTFVPSGNVLGTMTSIT